MAVREQSSVAGSDGKVVRIVVDDKRENKQGSESKVETIRNKLERIREGPVPAQA